MIFDHNDLLFSIIEYLTIQDFSHFCTTSQQLYIKLADKRQYKIPFYMMTVFVSWNGIYNKLRYHHLRELKIKDLIFLNDKNVYKNQSFLAMIMKNKITLHSKYTINVVPYFLKDGFSVKKNRLSVSKYCKYLIKNKIVNPSLECQKFKRYVNDNNYAMNYECVRVESLFDFI